MIPSLVLVAWKPKQRIPVPIPVILLWPFALLVFVVAWIVGGLVPRIREHTVRLLLVLRALASMRGFRVVMASDDEFLMVRVI